MRVNTWRHPHQEEDVMTRQLLPPNEVRVLVANTVSVAPDKVLSGGGGSSGDGRCSGGWGC